jgi:hypothetical protein
MSTEETRIYTDKDLLTKVKEKYPETGGMTFTGIVDWALRKLLQAKEA